MQRSLHLTNVVACHLYVGPARLGSIPNDIAIGLTFVNHQLGGISWPVPLGTFFGLSGGILLLWSDPMPLPSSPCDVVTHGSDLARLKAYSISVIISRQEPPSKPSKLVSWSSGFSPSGSATQRSVPLVVPSDSRRGSQPAFTWPPSPMSKNNATGLQYDIIDKNHKIFLKIFLIFFKYFGFLNGFS